MLFRSLVCWYLSVILWTCRVSVNCRQILCYYLRCSSVKKCGLRKIVDVCWHVLRKLPSLFYLGIIDLILWYMFLWTFDWTNTYGGAQVSKALMLVEIFLRKQWKWFDFYGKSVDVFEYVYKMMLYDWIMSDTFRGFLTWFSLILLMMSLHVQLEEIKTLSVDCEPLELKD